MRLFAAVDLDERVRRAVRDLQDTLKPRFGREVRWNGVEQLHLTLVFLGEVPDEKAAAVVRTIGAPIESRTFQASFGGIGMFPPHGAPRVLWIGVERGREEMVALQRIAVARVEAAGCTVQDREFHPHLTLARWRDSKPSDRRRALESTAAAASRMTADTAAITVDHVTLYQSRLSSKGATYVSLARGELTA